MPWERESIIFLLVFTGYYSNPRHVRQVITSKAGFYMERYLARVHGMSNGSPINLDLIKLVYDLRVTFIITSMLAVSKIDT